MKILVGNFQLGLHNVRLYANTDSMGGHVNLKPKDGGSAEIYVGIDDEAFGDVQATLLHELYEAVLIDLGTRYAKRPAFSDESSNFMFFLTHNEFDEAHSRVSWFLTRALGPFKDVYKKFWRDKHRAERKKKK